VLADPLLAQLDEAVDAEFLDVPLRFEGDHRAGGRAGRQLRLRLLPQLLLDLHLDPQALAVEAVLVALRSAEHGAITLEDVLVGPAPGVVDSHRVIGRDRAVDERPAGLRSVLLDQLAEDLLPFPEREDLALQSWKINAGLDFLEHRGAPLSCRKSERG